MRNISHTVCPSEAGSFHLHPVCTFPQAGAGGRGPHLVRTEEQPAYARTTLGSCLCDIHLGVPPLTVNDAAMNMSLQASESLFSTLPGAEEWNCWARDNLHVAPRGRQPASQVSLRTSHSQKPPIAPSPRQHLLPSVCDHRALRCWLAPVRRLIRAPSCKVNSSACFYWVFIAEL